MIIIVKYISDKLIDKHLMEILFLHTYNIKKKLKSSNKRIYFNHKITKYILNLFIK